MLGFIKKLLSALGAILKLPLTLLSLPAKLLSSGKSKGKAAEAAPKQSKSEAFFLEEAEAKGVPAATTKKKAAKAKKSKEASPAAVPTAASALNLPQPTVTTTTTAPIQANNYTKFGPRRRPGANMKSYLDMAKNIKNA